MGLNKIYNRVHTLWTPPLVSLYVGWLAIYIGGQIASLLLFTKAEEWTGAFDIKSQASRTLQSLQLQVTIWPVVCSEDTDAQGIYSTFRHVAVCDQLCRFSLHHRCTASTRLPGESVHRRVRGSTLSCNQETSGSFWDGGSSCYAWTQTATSVHARSVQHCCWCGRCDKGPVSAGGEYCAQLLWQM